jgi:uncharacterized membrane protein YphA (DoxX/SURF4 family)
MAAETLEWKESAMETHLAASMRASSSSEPTLLHPAIAWTGRALFALIFLLSGVAHMADVPGYAALMPPGAPFKGFWVVTSGLVELGGATLMLSNHRPRLGAWLIVLFLVPVTIVVHGGGIVSAATPEMRGIEVSFFLKGLAMTGAALIFTQVGVRAPTSRA